MIWHFACRGFHLMGSRSFPRSTLALSPHPLSCALSATLPLCQQLTYHRCPDPAAPHTTPLQLLPLCTHRTRVHGFLSLHGGGKPRARGVHRSTPRPSSVGSSQDLSCATKDGAGSSLEHVSAARACDSPSPAVLRLRPGQKGETRPPPSALWYLLWHRRRHCGARVLRSQFWWDRQDQG